MSQTRTRREGAFEMAKDLPELSRFELQCLRRIWARGEASVREIRLDLPAAPSYSTVRKILERLEAKGAVERARLDGRAWVYRSTVGSSAMIRKEVRRLIDGLFDGRGDALVAHLADTNAISLEDLKEIENQLRDGNRPMQDRKSAARQGGRKS
jgi:BlaI family transcriptional regulator, penicillinase repressor